MKYPFEFQKQQVPLLELSLSIIMLGSFLNDLLLILVYNKTIEMTERSQMIFSTLFLVLFTIKCQNMRLTIYLLMPAFITLILSKYNGHNSYLIVFVALLFQFAYVGLVMIMPQYDYPKPTGKYLVGFKEITLKNGDCVSIYYPTLTKSKIRSINSCRGKDYVKQVYNDFQHVLPKRPPVIFIYWMLGFLNKLRVDDIEVDSPIIDGKLPCIVFSNGLGGLKDHYSIFYKEWASNGYIVYSIQQEEITIILNDKEIHQYKVGEATLENDLGKQILNKIKIIRHEQLNDRVSKFSLLLDYVYTQQNIDFTKIIAAGHSFGAATVHRTAQIDKRITSGIILFDPWFLPFKEETLNIQLNIPLLSVNSETFRLRKENETPQRYNIVFNAQNQKLVIMIKGSQHLCTTDLVFKMPFELKMFTKLNNLNKILQITIAHLRLSQYFLNNLSPQKTLAEYEKFSTQYFRVPIHEIEFK